MREQGIVTSVKGKHATVKVDKKTECDKCGMCLFPQGASSTEFNVANKIGASEGDLVTIETAKDAKFMGAMLVFFVPLVLIALSMVLAVVVIKNEIYALLISVVSIAIWFFVLSIIDKKLKNTKSFSPQIVSIDVKNVKI